MEDQCDAPTFAPHSPSTGEMLVYNAVPKCGSVAMRTLVRALARRNHFPYVLGSYRIHANTVPYHYSKSELHSLLEDDLSRYKQPWYYFRHLHFVNFTDFGKIQPSYMNIVRDPVNRLASFYYYRRHNNHIRQTFDHRTLYLGVDLEDIQRNINMSFDDCVAFQKPECVNTKFLFTIIPHFCGQQEVCLFPTEKALAQAKQNVIRYFPVVGYLEKFDELVEVLEAVWPRFYRGAVGLYRQIKGDAGTRHKTENMSVPNQATRNTLMPRLGLEYDFYRFIIQRFHCLYNYMYHVNTIQNNIRYSVSRRS